MKLSCITSIVALLGLGSLATADIFRVDPDGQGDYLTINEAVDDVPDGSTILLSEGHYPESIWFNDRELIIRGEGDVMISGCRDCEDAGWSSVLWVSFGSNVRLENITVASNPESNRPNAIGGLWIEESESVTITNCQFLRNHFYGIRITGQCGPVEIVDTISSDNDGAGLLIDDTAVGTTTVSSSSFTENKYPGWPSVRTDEWVNEFSSGIRAEGNSQGESGATLHVSDTLFRSNEARKSGSGMFIGSGMDFVTINHCQFVDNQPVTRSSNGIGLSIHGADADNPSNVRVKVDDCTFKDNSSSKLGGAVGLENLAGSTVKFTGCAFESNSGGKYGGAVAMQSIAESTISFNACIFERNHAKYGGAIYLRRAGNNLNVLFKTCEFRNNTATDSEHGNAIRNTEPLQVVVQNCTICDGFEPIVGGWVEDNNVYEDECLEQSCCLSGHCSDKSEMECLERGGTWHGNMSCDEVVCDPIEGACCLGSWCATMTKIECDQHNGVYQGNGSKCEPGYTCEPRKPGRL